jgi:hypothetical protein
MDDSTEMREMDPTNPIHVAEFLDNLRDSGITNMFGAGPYIEEAFDVDRRTARTLLKEWMRSF